MNEQDIAIRLTGVKKRYKLGQIGGGTLTADLQSWWARLRGKEDPNLPVNMDQRLVGKTFMALNGVDLTVHKGEALGIIGCNGAGKSTLLKLLCRVTAPTEGEIDIYGRIASMLEVGTGFNGEMTGRENIYMNGAILGMTKAEIDAKMEDIIEFSEVRDFIDTPVKRYSSGMFVKLAFSVAAHLDSEIMIMDEVLAVGDVNFQQKCLKKMREVAQVEGRTVLYVSHNMGTIRQLCDRCIVLDKGKIIFDGDVEDAIGVYAKGNMLALQSDYDVSKIKRLEGITEACHLNAVHLDCGSMAREKKLCFSLDYDSRREIPDVMLRFVICSAGGAAVGTAYSQTFTLRPGESTVQLEFDGKNLAPGEYVADLITISYDGTTQTRHDIVVRAFAFTVEEDEPLYNMKWNTNGWGSIHFDDVRVLEGKNG